MMKKLAPFVLFLGLATCVIGQGKTVPPAVESAFGKQYAGIQAIGWSEEDGVWESRFVQSGMEADAQYAADGKWIKSKFSVPNDHIPALVMQSLNQNFGHFQLEQVVMHDSPEVGMQYEVEIESDGNEIQMLMDESGKIIGREVEQSNDE